MLELIVLGQIPGTEIYVSFSEILISLGVSAVASGFMYMVVKIHHMHMDQKNNEIEDQAI